MKKARAAKGRVGAKARAEAKAKGRPKQRATAQAKREAKPKAKAKAKPKAAPKAKPKHQARAKPKAAPKAKAKHQAKAKSKAAPKAKSRPKAKPELHLVAKPKATKAETSPKAKPRISRATPPANANGNARTRRRREAPPESTEKTTPATNGAPAHPVDLAATAYDTDVLTVLVREAETDDPREADEKIRRHLAEKNLGEFDSGRIDQLRALKTAVVEELQRTKDSSYFRGTHGLYASPEDFDHKRLAQDFSERFPSISHEAIVGFIPFAIYCYYLR